MFLMSNVVTELFFFPVYGCGLTLHLKGTSPPKTIEKYGG